MNLKKDVELKISNIPTPDVQDSKERRRQDAEQLRQIAADISNATHVKIAELIRPKLDQHRIDRYNVTCTVKEEDAEKVIVALNGCKLETTGTTIRVSRTGNTVKVIGRVDQDVLDDQLKNHLASVEVGQA